MSQFADLTNLVKDLKIKHGWTLDYSVDVLQDILSALEWDVAEDPDDCDIGDDGYWEKKAQIELELLRRALK